MSIIVLIVSLFVATELVVGRSAFKVTPKTTPSCAECKEVFHTDRNGVPVSYHLMGSELCWECFVEWRA